MSDAYTKNERSKAKDLDIVFQAGPRPPMVFIDLPIVIMRGMCDLKNEDLKT